MPVLFFAQLRATPCYTLCNAVVKKVIRWGLLLIHNPPVTFFHQGKKVNSVHEQTSIPKK